MLSVKFFVNIQFGRVLPVSRVLVVLVRIFFSDVVQRRRDARRNGVRHQPRVHHAPGTLADQVFLKEKGITVKVT